MRIMPAMKFGDWLGIAFTSFRLYQHTLLKMRFEQALQCDEESRAVVAMPIGVPAGHDFRVVNLYFHLRIAGQRCIKGVEKKIAVKTMPGRHNAIELEL